jgi:hypothetical protein
MNIEKAVEMCRGVAEERIRWGKHAGFGDNSSSEVLDALVCIYESGMLEAGDAEKEREKRILANRQKGAAEARAKRAENKLAAANERIKELTIALQDCEQEK